VLLCARWSSSPHPDGYRRSPFFGALGSLASPTRIWTPTFSVAGPAAVISASSGCASRYAPGRANVNMRVYSHRTDKVAQMIACVVQVCEPQDSTVPEPLEVHKLESQMFASLAIRPDYDA